MLSCHRAQELIHPYIDGELDQLQAAEIERHIDQCESCNLDYRNQHTLRSTFKDNSFYHRAPPDLKKRIRSSLQEEAQAEVTRVAFRWAWFILGTSLALLLLIGTALR